MKSLPSIRKLAPMALLMLLPLLPGCRRDSPVPEPEPERVPAPPALLTNNLGQLPGAVYRHAAESPIRWQPWMPDTLELASAANRMLFAIITMPQQPGFAATLEALENDRQIVATLNDFYVPVLIDGDSVREIGLITADLCAEINHPLVLPLFLWMSPDANPVAWIPAPAGDAGRVSELFFQSHSMVSRIWQEDPDYVRNNSALDNENRANRISARRNRDIASEEPALDTMRAVRQLTSLYDPLSRNFDEVGGLFPAGAIDLLASAAMQPDVPADVRQRALETTRELLDDLLGSAMFDPLDGGLFAARRGPSWSLPVFHRDALNQSRAAFALFRAHRATGDALALERALGMLSFIEDAFRTSDGLFSVGFTPGSDPEGWIWSTEDVESVLDEADAAWWIALTGMRGLGNIPYEADPRRDHFRGNTIALADTVEKLAAAEGVPLDEFAKRLDAVKTRLAAHRAERLGGLSRDDMANAAATFRMVSAYAAAFTSTGEPAWRDKAADLLGQARVAFSEGARLRTFAREGPPSLVDARAFTYTLAIQAILDLVEISGDESWLNWCDDLATVMTELFTDDGFLSEVSEAAAIINLPVTDIIMLFDDSSVGLLSFAECRLTARNRPLVRELSAMAAPLPLTALDRPVIHSDLLQAFISRLYPVVVVHGPETPAELMREIETLPLRMIHRRPAGPADELPAGACLVLRGDAEPVVVLDAAGLAAALLPVDAGP